MVTRRPEGGPRRRRPVQWVGIPYLAGCVVAAPFLITRGLRTVRRWREAEAAYRQGAQKDRELRKAGVYGPYRPVPESANPAVSRGKGLGVSLIALAAGVGMTLHSYSQAGARTGGRFFTFVGLIAVGLLGVIYHLTRRDDGTGET